VWSLILGYAVWGEIPTVHLLVGSSIMVASGLFLLWRESRRQPVPPVATAEAADEPALAAVPRASSV
jgi:hypothetical protein